LPLDFWNVEKPLKIEEIRRVSPKVAEHYSRKSRRTIQRDIEFLVEKDLVEKRQGGYLPNRETLFEFLPTRVIPD